MQLHELETELRAGRKVKRGQWREGWLMLDDGATLDQDGDECSVGLDESLADDWELVPETDECDGAFERILGLGKFATTASAEQTRNVAKAWFRSGWEAHAERAAKVDARRLYVKWCSDSDEWPDEGCSQQANSFKAGVDAALAEVGK